MTALLESPAPGHGELAGDAPLLASFHCAMDALSSSGPPTGGGGRESFDVSTLVNGNLAGDGGAPRTASAPASGGP